MHRPLNKFKFPTTRKLYNAECQYFLINFFYTLIQSIAGSMINEQTWDFIAITYALIKSVFIYLNKIRNITIYNQILYNFFF